MDSQIKPTYYLFQGRTQGVVINLKLRKRSRIDKERPRMFFLCEYAEDRFIFFVTLYDLLAVGGFVEKVPHVRHDTFFTIEVLVWRITRVQM